jgi:hypothetical protein
MEPGSAARNWPSPEEMPVSRPRRTPSHAPLRTSGARFWVTASVRLPHAGCGRPPQAWPQSATHVRGGWCGDGMPARLGDDAAEALTAGPSDDAVASAGRGTTGSNAAGTCAATSSSSSSSAIAVNVTAVSRHLDGACDGTMRPSSSAPTSPPSPVVEFGGISPPLRAAMAPVPLAVERLEDPSITHASAGGPDGSPRSSCPPARDARSIGSTASAPQSLSVVRPPGVRTP